VVERLLGLGARDRELVGGRSGEAEGADPGDGQDQKPDPEDESPAVSREMRKAIEQLGHGLSFA
jgi:hypothetical protein